MEPISIALKKLKQNDVAFLDPTSASHQQGFLLPRRAFGDMFLDLIYDKSVNVPKKDLLIRWMRLNGDVLGEHVSRVSFYHSKNELRVTRLPKDLLRPILREGMLLLFNKDDELDVTLLPAGSEHLLEILDKDGLLGMIPPRS